MMNLAEPLFLFLQSEPIKIKNVNRNIFINKQQ